ncbi:Bug family tripartite tricarboxylate transporter substrate binding protein [Zwartia sp.]|uniref:Bug family tripartite tricarboxylate transporter substrate binding protein n=1 Tax=Zwartia sp. TaxID=2978004 RepID=UPI003BB10CE1
MKILFKALCAFAISTFAFAGVSVAQDVYPSKAIKLIVPLGAGGATDVVARVVAAKLSQRLGQPVVVENRPGAEGVIGVNAGAKAEPDGYTLVLGSSTTLAANYHLRKSLPFHPVNDLAPVSMALKDFYNVLVINPNVPAKNLKEFIAYAKANPGKINYGTATVGSKICMEMFRTMAGIDLKMISYKSSSQALNDLMGGQIQIVCEPVATSVPNIKADKLRSIGVTSLTRVQQAPDLPTVAELGLPGFDYSAWVGVFAPAKTPQAIIDRLSKEFEIVLKDPETDAKIRSIGAAPMIGDSKQLANLLNQEIAKAGKIVKDAGIQPE